MAGLGNKVPPQRPAAYCCAQCWRFTAAAILIAQLLLSDEHRRSLLDGENSLKKIAHRFVLLNRQDGTTQGEKSGKDKIPVLYCEIRGVGPKLCLELHGIRQFIHHNPAGNLTRTVSVYACDGTMMGYLR